MSIDRFIKWGKPPTWGPPTAEKLAAVAKDFLGEGWTTKIEPFPAKDGCWIQIVSDIKCSFHLSSERPEIAGMYDVQEGDEPFYRWFQVYFPSASTGEETSVITRHVDSFTNVLANRYTEIIATWWHGEVEWPS